MRRVKWLFFAARGKEHVFDLVEKTPQVDGFRQAGPLRTIEESLLLAGNCLRREVDDARAGAGRARFAGFEQSVARETGRVDIAMIRSYRAAPSAARASSAVLATSTIWSSDSRIPFTLESVVGSVSIARTR